MPNGSTHNSYTDNVYAMLKRKGLAGKFEHPGIYCIYIDNHLVYIGKSRNMLKRIAQHYVGIQIGASRKYRILAEAKRHGHTVKFDVGYYAKATNSNEITEELGQKEGEYIRKYLPPLNTQIPKEGNWHSHTVNPIAENITLDEIIAAKPL